jgi:hypothetical protein
MDSGESDRCRTSVWLPWRARWLVLAAAALAGCGSPYYTSAPIEAWVVDAETGAPIEGAVVTANWQLVASSLDTGGRKLHQLEVMEAVTDKAGRFHFPGFTRINFTLEQLREEDPQILIFKRGYRYARFASDGGATGNHRSSAVIGSRISLTKAAHEAKEVARDLAFLAAGLEHIADSGQSQQVTSMTRSLVCERRRLKAIDAGVILSVPGETTKEVACETH